MKYPDDQEVKIGDKVKLGQDANGIVVCLIDKGKYSDEYPEAEWSYLEKGILINFPVHGLIHYEKLESDVQLLARKNNRLHTTVIKP